MSPSSAEKGDVQMPQPTIRPHKYMGRTVTAVSLMHDTFDENVSDHPFQPICRSAWVGAFVMSRFVTTLPIQKGRKWLYESTSAIRGYSDLAGYLLR